MTVRSKLSLLVLGASFVTSAFAQTVPSGPPLATGKSKWLGSAYSSPSQTLHFEKYWNQVVPENAGKWGSVEGTRDVMNWSALDAAYNFAKANNFPFRLHVLIWGNQQPAWIETLSTAEQLEEIEEWFAAVAARYPDLDIIEVVNEPLHDPPNAPGSGNYINALGGSGTSGWDWVLNAFRRARVHFPNARLMLNDYSVTNATSNAQAYLNIVNLLKAENLINALGVQGHAFETRVPASTITSCLDLLASANVPLYVTELDVDGLSDQVQLEDYQRIFPAFWEHPAVYGVTLWGWRPGLWRTAQGAYLVLETGTERPAMQWLKTYVGNHAPVVPAHTFAVAEGSGAGTVVGTAQAMDLDGTTFQTWAITGGTGANLFAINSTTGQITVANGAALTAASHTLNLTVRDPHTVSASGTVTIHVSNQPQKVIGGGYEFAANITHANGNVYDQILLTGATTTFRADAGQIVRASYIDLSHDIVQVEFSGAGTVTVTLAGATPPAVPEKYNQGILYVKGHATITVTGADENTHLAIFTVGKITAVNQSLFKDVPFDGVADVALVSVSSPSARFGGLRTSNTEFWATSGNTGIHAPGVRFSGPVFAHNISAQEQATPVLLTGIIDPRSINGVTIDNCILITGGDLAQANGRAVQFGDAARLYMGAGTDSHNNPQAAKTNQATFERNGVSFTPILLP